MKFFHKNAVGLDISDHSVEVVSLVKTGSGFETQSLGRSLLAPGIVESGIVKNAEKLREAISKATELAHPSKIVLDNVVFGLPESIVYTHIFSFESGSDKNLKTIIQDEAKQNIPLPQGDLTLSYKTYQTAKGSTTCVLVAISTEKFSGWQKFFDDSHIRIRTFDIEIFALFRSLFKTPPKTSVCIVDIGALSTHVAIFNANGLQHEYIITSAGSQLTKIIASSLKKDEKEAEQLKKKVGLSKPGDPVSHALIKTLQPIVDNIKNTLSYFTKKTGQQVAEIVLAGGSSVLKGLTEYVSISTDIPTRLGIQSVVSQEDSKILPLYYEAVGLALRGLDESWHTKDPEFLLGTHTIPAKAKKNSEPAPAARAKKVTHSKESGLNKVNSKLRIQKIILISLIIIGIIVALLSFWYRGYQKEQTEEKIQEQLELLDEQKSFFLDFSDSEEKNIIEEEEKTVVDNGITDIVIEDAILQEVRVLITETPTGWLNTRIGPGLGYEQITRVNPGEEYQLLEESNDWYKINIPPQEEGGGEAIQAWITSQYAIIINN